MEIKCRKAVGGVAEGEALVTGQRIYWNGGVDFRTGKISDPKHEHYGTSVRGKILVYPGSRGSLGNGACFMATFREGNGPKGVILTRTHMHGHISHKTSFRHDPNSAIMVVATGIPSVDELLRNPLEFIETGDHVIVNADKGLVTVFKKNQD